MNAGLLLHNMPAQAGVWPLDQRFLTMRGASRHVPAMADHQYRGGLKHDAVNVRYTDVLMTTSRYDRVRNRDSATSAGECLCCGFQLVGCS